MTRETEPDAPADALPAELRRVKDLHWYTGSARGLWQRPRPKRRWTFRLHLRHPRLAAAAALLIALLAASMLCAALVKEQKPQAGLDLVGGYGDPRYSRVIWSGTDRVDGTIAPVTGEGEDGGRININTADSDVLRTLLPDEGLADPQPFGLSNKVWRTGRSGSGDLSHFDRDFEYGAPCAAEQLAFAMTGAAPSPHHEDQPDWIRLAQAPEAMPADGRPTTEPLVTPTPTGRPEAVTRMIVREGTLDVQVADVPSAAIRLAALVQPDMAEYVARNQLWRDGEGNQQAVLTLRVRPERLDEVVTRVAELGKVLRQDIGSRDVTAAYIDVDARLRNEQRVEVELLDLLAKRSDAPLKEIVEVRQHLSDVRGRIEQLAASRAGLAKMVALSTLTVNLYQKAPEPTKTEEDSLGRHFGEAVAGGWSGALRFLADSLGWLIRILVGGLPWAVLGLLILAFILRSLRRK